MPKARTRLSGNDIILQIKQWWSFVWRDYARYSSCINSIDTKILKKKLEIEDLLIQRERYVADMEAELEEVEHLGKSQYDIGEEFEISWKDIEKRFPEPTLPPVDIAELKKFLNPHFCMQFGLKEPERNSSKNNHRRKQGLNKSSPPFDMERNDGIGSFTLDDFAKHDKSAIPFRENRDKHGNNENKSKRKQRMSELRKDNPKYDDESQADWDKRINELLSDEGFGH